MNLTVSNTAIALEFSASVLLLPLPSWIPAQAGMTEEDAELADSKFNFDRICVFQLWILR